MTDLLKLNSMAAPEAFWILEDGALLLASQRWPPRRSRRWRWPGIAHSAVQLVDHGTPGGVVVAVSGDVASPATQASPATVYVRHSGWS